MGEVIVEWIDHIRTNDFDFFVHLHQDWGYLLLLFILPLSIFQGIFSIFPFATIVFINVLSFGIVKGFVFSWIGSFLGAVVCFIFARYLFYDWVQKRWEKRMEKYEGWQSKIDRYGLWVVILLRTIPIVPSNIISFMAAISPIKLRPYLWSSIIGNISMLWLYGTLSASIFFPNNSVFFLWVLYSLFCAIMVGGFFLTAYKKENTKKRVKSKESSVQP